MCVARVYALLLLSLFAHLREFQRQTDPNYAKSMKQKEWQNYKKRKEDELLKAGVAKEEMYVF